MTQLLSSSPNQETSEVIGRILVTDDNTAIHEDFDKILAPAEDRGDLSDMEMALFGESAPAHVTPKFELFHANQGQVAYEMVKEMKERGETLDMGFIDMRMPPGWDGVETVEKLWEVDPDLQIVICTAFSDYNWSDVLERLGTNDKLLLLKKPFERSEVTQLALALTKKRQAERVAKLNRASMEATIEQQVRQINQAQHDADRMLSAISSVVIGIDGNHRVSRVGTKRLRTCSKFPPILPSAPNLPRFQSTGTIAKEPMSPIFRISRMKPVSPFRSPSKITRTKFVMFSLPSSR